MQLKKIEVPLTEANFRVLLQPLQREGSEHQMVNVGMPHGRRVVIPDDQDFRTNHEKVLYGILLERQK